MHCDVCVYGQTCLRWASEQCSDFREAIDPTVETDLEPIDQAVSSLWIETIDWDEMSVPIVA